MTDVHTGSKGGRPAELERRLAALAQRDAARLAAWKQTGAAFAPAGAGEKDRAAARARLEAKGAVVRNGGASVWVGGISPACIACTGGFGSRTFMLSSRCNRRCYFCFNANQERFAQVDDFNASWQEEFDAFAASVPQVTHVALTGGEPLVHRAEALAFFDHARAQAPDAHLRLYTDGDFLDCEVLERLRAAELDELRVSVKTDDPACVPQTLERLERACAYVPDVMVETPAIPGTGALMRELLDGLDRIGAAGINLLEFAFPFTDWAPFAARGFVLRNPPFAVPYDYEYATGLPVAGSEELALELMEYAVDRGLRIGLHYCSVENKTRDQVLRQNAPWAARFAAYELDEGDFFLKTLKVFGPDAGMVRPLLPPQDCAHDGPDALAVHPRHASRLADLGVEAALSYNIVEVEKGAPHLRELRLDPPERTFDHA
jgi:pyruvate formate-lyase activating enzyme-like uncharacterized protein